MSEHRKNKKRGWLVKLLTKYKHKKKESGELKNSESIKQPFSPLTYCNPCIPYMRTILEEILRQRGLTYQNLSLVLIDGEQKEEKFAEGRDLEREFYSHGIVDDGLVLNAVTLEDADVREVLNALTPDLNALALVTDRFEFYREFVYSMYVENGLLVQLFSKNEVHNAKGNVIMDFERSMDTCACLSGHAHMMLPVYKKPWEISENLDMEVPVGYNTLVIGGTLFKEQEGLKQNGKEEYFNL